MATESGLEAIASESEAAGNIDEAHEFEEEFVVSEADPDLRSAIVNAVVARRGLDFGDLKDEYANLWAEMAIRRERLPEVDRIVDRIVRIRTGTARLSD